MHKDKLEILGDDVLMFSKLEFGENQCFTSAHHKAPTRFPHSSEFKILAAWVFGTVRVILSRALAVKWLEPKWLEHLEQVASFCVEFATHRCILFRTRSNALHFI